MKYYGININLGDTSFGVPKKSVLTEPSALLAGSAIAGGASLLGSVLGISSQSAANKANLQIARENNAAQYQMFKEANAFNRQERLESEKFNRSMLREQQYYNSPVAQAQRLAAAGLNPGNIMDGNSAQAVTSVPSSSPASSAAPPSLQGAHMEPVISASDIGGLANNFASAVKLMNEANAVSIDNQTKAERNVVELQSMRESIENMLESRKLSKVQRRYLKGQIDSLNYEIAVQKFNLDHLQDSWNMTNEQHQKMMQQFDDAHNRATIEQKSMQLAYDLENEFGRPLRSWQVKKLQSEFSKANAEIGLILAQKGLTNAQMYKTFADRAKVIAEKIGIDQNNEHFKNVVDDIESQLHLSGMRANRESKMANTWFGRFTEGLGGFGRSVIQPLSPFSGFFK